MKIVWLTHLFVITLTQISSEANSFLKLAFSPTNKSRREIKYKGITFVGDKYCPEISYENPLSKISMDRLKLTGANWVAIVVTEYLDNLGSTVIKPLYGKEEIKTQYYTYKTETQKGLIELIDHAHEIGLKVLLKPHIDLAIPTQYNVFWRGNIGSEFRTEEQWKAWFASYKNFIVKYAKIAESKKVEMFSVSCELISTNHRESDWRDIILHIRENYKGQLVDSANHDGEENAKTWWDAVDYIAVDAYYLPLYSTIDYLKTSTEAILTGRMTSLARLSQQFGKKVIITEIGFCSGACKIGDRSYQPSQSDFESQALAYDTFMWILNKYEFIEGYFWWAWNSDPYYGGDKDHCISPQNKQAEETLRSWYAQKNEITNCVKDPLPSCLCTI